VLRLLPKLPMLSSSGAGAGGVSSSMQYPKAEPQSNAALAAASSSSSVTADAAQSSQQMQGCDQAPEQTQQDMQDSSGGTGGSSGASSSSIAALLAPVGPCPICSTSEILVPFVAHPCRHVFCYYCLQSHCAADSEFQCPVDGVRVDALQRYVRAVPVAPG
jgi:peroxin-2